MRDFLSKGVIQASAKRLELDELPPHDAEGMLPPRVDGEGLFAPYRISLDHFIDRFATGPDRAQLSASLLAFRRSVHEVLMVSPAMWIAGSFVELRAHQPEDIDAVVFFERTGVWKNPADDERKMASTPELFAQGGARAAFGMDVSFVALHQPTTLARAIHYYALYAHTRTGVWRGFVELPEYDKGKDAAAVARLGARLNSQKNLLG